MPLLEIDKLSAFYGDFQALYEVSMSIDSGDIIAVIGANGAGKSTLIKSMVGLVPVASNMVVFDGRRVGGRSVNDLVRGGISVVMEGRRLFTSLNVEENLLIGAASGRSGFWSMQRVLELFPGLQDHLKRQSMLLSGGQQQMVAIGRALMSNPRLLLCDELSLGLAPIVVRDIYKSLPAIATQGTAVVIVEQDVVQALTASRYMHCLREGRVSLSGPSQMFTRDMIRQSYFGA